jgi:four helix bundle protein
MANVVGRMDRTNGPIISWMSTASPMRWESALTLKLPRFELYEEGSQTRRSSKSVSAQIVEGHALRQYRLEYLHYLGRAYGSAEEVIEHLTYMMETDSAKNVFEECRNLRREYTTLCRKLFNYMQAVQRQHDPKRCERND